MTQTNWKLYDDHGEAGLHILSADVHDPDAEVICENILDAETANLLLATPALLLAAERAYAALPITATPEEFLQGHGNWGLPEAEHEDATIFATAIVLARHGAEALAGPKKTKRA